MISLFPERNIHTHIELKVFKKDSLKCPFYDF